MSRRDVLRWAASLAVVGGVVGCDAPSSPGAPVSPTSTPPRSRTPPFTGEPLDVALVRDGAEGPAASRWLWGAQQQASAANIRLSRDPRREVLGQEARSLRRALSTHPDALLLDQGFQAGGPGLGPLLRAALGQVTGVVAYNFHPNDVGAMPVVLPDDVQLTDTVLTRMAADVPAGASVALLAYPTGFAAQDRRAAAWKVALARYGWVGVTLAHDVTVNLDNVASPTSRNGPIIAAALRSLPQVQAAFAVDAVLASDAAKALSADPHLAHLRLYAVVDQDFDPAPMTAPGSVWVASALPDPAELGAASVRTLALRVAGELKGDNRITWVGGPLIEQTLLQARGVTSLASLHPFLAQQQAANPVTAATTGWLPNALSG